MADDETTLTADDIRSFISTCAAHGISEISDYGISYVVLDIDHGYSIDPGSLVLSLLQARLRVLELEQSLAEEWRAPGGALDRAGRAIHVDDNEQILLAARDRLQDAQSDASAQAVEQETVADDLRCIVAFLNATHRDDWATAAGCAMGVAVAALDRMGEPHEATREDPAP